MSGSRSSTGAAHLRRTAFFFGALGLVACGLVFSPGEYAGPSLDGALNVPDAAAAGDGPGNREGGAPGLPRIIVVAGRRESVEGESGDCFVAETMRTTISPAGELGSWAWEMPPPALAMWSQGDREYETT